MRNIYHKTVPDTGSGLSVAIGREGIAVSEVTSVAGLIDNPPAPLLVVTRTFSWKQYRERERVYSGDNGAGNMRARLVASAISLIAYWSGEETWLDTLEDFEEVS
jgi:hypothetical protein